jgi:hypothetical protein
MKVDELEVNINDIHIGDVISVSTDYGRGPLEQGEVIEIDDNIGNKAGVAYVINKGTDAEKEKWAYLYQIRKIN